MELGDEKLVTEESSLFGGIRVIEGVTAEGKPFRAIPYYLWNNRGEGKMNVWLRQRKDGKRQEERVEDAAGRFFPETKREKPVLLYEKDDLMYSECVK